MNRTQSVVSLNETLPRGGAIKRRKISEKLYVDFYYFGNRITKSTGLDDTPQNREKVRTFLDKIMQKIEARTFKFADAFTLKRSIVLGKEKERLKNEFRYRRISMTEAIRNVISWMQALAPESPYLFPMDNGRPFDGNSFRKIVWNKALKESLAVYKTPYSTRHTFCAWALTIGMNLMKVVNLMGHSSKEMVYQTYGEYVEDLEDDMDDIFQYFGQDFLIKPAKRRTPNLSHGDSFGVSMLPVHATY